MVACHTCYVRPKFKVTSGTRGRCDESGHDVAPRLVGSGYFSRRLVAASQSESRRTFSCTCERPAEAPASPGGYRVLRDVCGGAYDCVRRLPERRSFSV